jgi:hypothetical protein
MLRSQALSIIYPASASRITFPDNRITFITFPESWQLRLHSAFGILHSSFPRSLSQP